MIRSVVLIFKKNYQVSAYEYLRSVDIRMFMLRLGVLISTFVVKIAI
jgi:hypothetical protein